MTTLIWVFACIAVASIATAQWGVALLSLIVMVYTIWCDQIIARRIKNQPPKVVVLKDDTASRLEETEFGRRDF